MRLIAVLCAVGASLFFAPTIVSPHVLAICVAGWAGWILYRTVRSGDNESWRIPLGVAVLVSFFFPLVFRTFYDHHVIFLVMGAQIVVTFFLQQRSLLQPLRRYVLGFLASVALILFVFPYVLFTPTEILDLRTVDPSQLSEGIRGVHVGILLLGISLEICLASIADPSSSTSRMAIP